MRALFVVVPLALAGCVQPEINSGAYLCGPDALCPDGHRCDGPTNTCVLEGLEEAWACPEMSEMTEPDDTAATGHVIATPNCISTPTIVDNCMLDGDTADWVTFTTPSACSGVGVEARVSFPIAFARLGLDLYDLTTNEVLASDTACTTGSGESGDELRCLQANLVPGGSYGIQVRPTGEGTCDGSCAHNRYTLRVQLSAPR